MANYDAGGKNIINASNIYTRDEIYNLLAQKDKAFKFTITTTTAGQIFTIPCQNVGTFNATISWGDGTTSTVTAYNSVSLAHAYTAIGTYNISISGSFPNIYFNSSGDRALINSVEQLGDVGWIRLDSAFSGCSNMTSFTVGNTDVSQVTNMSSFLRGCTKVESIDFSGLDTSNVTDMSFMFFFGQKITSIKFGGKFNTSKVTSMQYMFGSCYLITVLDLSCFDTANVVDMSSMFQTTNHVVSLDLSSFRTPKLTKVYSMFEWCSAAIYIDISNFDTSKATSFSSMFNNCAKLISVAGIEKLNIASVTSFTNFITSGKITTAQYDALLINWNGQVAKPNMTITFNTSKYTANSTAATARANLISSDGWTITDGGTA